MAARLFEELPPPHKDDVLFGPSDDDVYANACLHISDSPEVLYSWGYLNAARKLRDHVLECNVDLDTIVFAIIYLYRQHIELVMKSMVLQGVEIIGRCPSPDEEKHLGCHNLSKIWADLKPIIEAVFTETRWEQPESEDIQAVDSYIRQLTEHQPDAFRFPAEKRRKKTDGTYEEGKHYLTELTHINIRTFSVCMEKLSSFLYDLDEAFRAYLDYLDEQQRQAEEWVNENLDSFPYG